MKPLILLACCASFAAHAEFYTGNELLGKINGNAQEQALAIGFIAGVADALRGVVHCIPPSVTLGQVHDMTRQRLENAPELRHMTADSFVAYVLGKTWPCPKRGTGT